MHIELCYDDVFKYSNENDSEWCDVLIKSKSYGYFLFTYFKTKINYDLYWIDPYGIKYKTMGDRYLMVKDYFISVDDVNIVINRAKMCFNKNCL